jgi:peroxiredoxin
MKSMKFIAALIVAGGVALGGALTSTQTFAAEPDPSKDAQPGKKDKKDEGKSAGATVGSQAPAWTLTDTDGKTHSLSDFKGKIVVIEWFNPECPFIVKHHKVNMTFNNLFSEYNSKNVVFLAINSSAKGKQGNGKELNVEMKKEYKMEYPILIDEDGKVGTAYGAKTTPHVFIIGTDGKVAYNGAIDNNTDVKKAGDKNYAKMALDEMLAGKSVTTSETRPYGCSVKYAK